MKILLRNTGLVFQTKALPTTWDYEILGFFGQSGEFYNPSSLTDFWWIDTYNKKIKHRVNGTNTEEVTPTEGVIVKMSSNLFGIYQSDDWVVLTDNNTKVNVVLEDGSYTYTSPATFEKVSSTTRKCGTISVQAGDVIVYRGVGENPARLLALKTGESTCVWIAASGSTHKCTSMFEVPSAATLYFTATKGSYDPFIYILRS